MAQQREPRKNTASYWHNSSEAGAAVTKKNAITASFHDNTLN